MGQNPSTFHEAEAFCSSLGMRLAAVDKAEALLRAADAICKDKLFTLIGWNKNNVKNFDATQTITLPIMTAGWTPQTLMTYRTARTRDVTAHFGRSRAGSPSDTRKNTIW